VVTIRRGFLDSLTSVSTLIDDLVHRTSETARVIGAVGQGDLSQTMDLEIDDRPLKGEFLRTAKTINKMVQPLGSFAAEVTRVAREVGTESKLGGEAQVEGVTGTWKDLTDSVNLMAGNLTSQVRNIADVTKAVAAAAQRASRGVLRGPPHRVYYDPAGNRRHEPQHEVRRRVASAQDGLGGALRGGDTTAIAR
jgi:methyl-accepting chemotaxis protein